MTFDIDFDHMAKVLMVLSGFCTIGIPLLFSPFHTVLFRKKSLLEWNIYIIYLKFFYMENFFSHLLLVLYISMDV